MLLRVSGRVIELRHADSVRSASVKGGELNV
jgi:hypothetical protein